MSYTVHLDNFYIRNTFVITFHLDWPHSSILVRFVVMYKPIYQRTGKVLSTVRKGKEKKNLTNLHAWHAWLGFIEDHKNCIMARVTLETGGD
jgi:hypothetical protein